MNKLPGKWRARHNVGEQYQPGSKPDREEWVMRPVLAVIVLGIVLGAVACGQSTSQPAPASTAGTTTAPPSPAPSPTPSPAPAVSCTVQVQGWLASQDGSPVSETVQHDITALLFDVNAYLQYAPGNPGAGANFLSFVNDEVTDLTYTSGPQIPACADPQNLWGALLPSGTFLGDASNAADDTSGTSQAQSDCQAVLSDFASLKSELASTAPGSGLKG